VLARRRFNVIYSTVPKSQGWLIIDYVVNATSGSLSNFFIFRRERLKDNYIKLCKPSTYMVMQKKAWMICFLFKEFLSFFKQYVPNGMSMTNRHLLVLNSHGSHITVKVVEQAHEFGLDMMGGPCFKVCINKKEYQFWFYGSMYMAFGSKCNEQKISTFKPLHKFQPSNNEGNETNNTSDEQDDHGQGDQGEHEEQYGEEVNAIDLLNIYTH
jgi:hypothetical protein